MVLSKKNQSGGDGYSVNVFSPIAGRPSYIKYTDNCKPIFEGSLLQNGGGQEVEKKNSKYYILDSSYQGGGGNGECNCNSAESKNALQDLLNQIQQDGQKGGGQLAPITQFSAIKSVSNVLTPLGTSALTATIVLIFLYHYVVKNKKKMKMPKMMGGFSASLESVLAPLGRNNLLVLAAILILHHYAVEKKRLMKGGNKKNKSNSIQGILNKLLAPTGTNSLGSSSLLVGLRKAFHGGMKKDSEDSKFSKFITPLGHKAFMAKGLMKQIEKLFKNEVHFQTAQSENKKNKLEKLKKEKWNDLFDTISPVTFSTFANKKSYQKAQNIRDYILSKN